MKLFSNTTGSFSKSFIGASFGTLLEYYDYALFPLFFPIFAPLFFPANSVYESISKGYVLLLVPILARPLGGLCFGFIGDMIGRRRALIGSMYGIALATMAIGFTPSCQTLGIMATVILMVAKTVQVFCFGGEYNGAGIYVVEHADNQREAFVSSLLASITILGSLLATVFGILATLSFMPAWSWRLAFIIGGALGLLGIRYRKNLSEPPHFEKGIRGIHHFKAMLKEHPKELVTGFFLGGFSTIPFTTVITFVMPVLMTKGFITAHQLMLILGLLTLVATVTVIPTGLIADRIGIEKVMRFAALSLALLAYPLLWLIDQGNLTLIILASALFIVVDEILLGPCNAYLKQLFKMQYRYRAASFSFCLGMAVMGGLTPILENRLYQLSGGHFHWLSAWLIVIALCTYFSMRWVAKPAEQPLLAQEARLASS